MLLGQIKTGGSLQFVLTLVYILGFFASFLKLEKAEAKEQEHINYQGQGGENKEKVRRRKNKIFE